MSVLTFKNSVSVHDGYGEYLGRLEAYNGDETNYALTFYPVDESELTEEDLDALAGYIRNRKEENAAK